MSPGGPYSGLDAPGRKPFGFELVSMISHGMPDCQTNGNKKVPGRG